MNMSRFIPAFLFVFLLAFAAHAQIPSLPKAAGVDPVAKQLLGILDNTKGLNLTSDQSSQLTANNKTFVDQLMKIAGSSDSEDAKKSSILNLKDGRLKFLTSLLGKELSQKYMGNVLKSVNPLKSKLGLAALAF